MRSFFKISLFLTIAFTAIGVFGQSSTSPATPKTAPRPTPVPQVNGQLAFPEIEGWEKDEIYVYPVAGGGYSVNYNSPTSGRVTVYAYDSGHKKIPNELKGLVKDELETAKGGIKAAVDAGVYTNLKEGKTQTVVLGGSSGKVSALNANFTLSRGDMNMNSSVYIFPYNNQFIKLRVTRPATTDKAADASFAKLLLDLDTFFSSK